jgi:hypothetical protein
MELDFFPSCIIHTAEPKKLKILQLFGLQITGSNWNRKLVPNVLSPSGPIPFLFSWVEIGLLIGVDEQCISIDIHMIHVHSPLWWIIEPSEIIKYKTKSPKIRHPRNPRYGLKTGYTTTFEILPLKFASWFFNPYISWVFNDCFLRILIFFFIF